MRKQTKRRSFVLSLNSDDQRCSKNEQEYGKEERSLIALHEQEE